MIFKRKTQQLPADHPLVLALAKGRAQFAERWTEGKATRPATFPDGSAFDPDPLIEPLFGMVERTFWRLDADVSERVWLYVVVTLDTIAQIASAPVSLRLINLTLTVRQDLLAAGQQGDERIVSAIALYIGQYQEQSGAQDAFIASTDGMTEEQLRELP